MTIPKTYAEARKEACQGCRDGLNLYSYASGEYVHLRNLENEPCTCTAPTRDAYEQRFVELLAERDAEIARMGQSLRKYKTVRDGYGDYSADVALRDLQSANAASPQPVESPEESADVKGESNA